MPEIIGPGKLVETTMAPGEAILSHLRHFTKPVISRDILISRYKRSKAQAKKDSINISAHVKQALEYHESSKKCSKQIKPVLQYYCYLNLAVAVIIAYRPMNYDGYRSHGVEDKTHGISNLNMSSPVIQVKKGAIPLIHSILSDEAINKKVFRLNEIIGAIPLLSYEIEAAFKKEIHVIKISDRVIQDATKRTWSSELTFTTQILSNEKAIGVQKTKLQKAIPILENMYNILVDTNSKIVYQTKQTWTTEGKAKINHNKNCAKIINFGGQLLVEDANLGYRSIYQWRYIKGKPLIPTITSTLLLSFVFATIARYRPILLEKIKESRYNLILDVFINETDGYIIPAFRNLLYREELAVMNRNLV
jgi:hypothetical protein